MLKLFKFLKFMFKFFFYFKCTCRPCYTFLLFYFLSKIFLLVLIRRVWLFSEPSSNNHITERDKSGQPLGTEWALFQVLIPVWPQCSGCWIPRQNNVTQTKRASLVLVSTTIRGIKINFRNRFLYCQVRLFTNTDGRARPARGASGAVWEQRSTEKLLKNYKSGNKTWKSEKQKVKFNPKLFEDRLKNLLSKNKEGNSWERAKVLLSTVVPNRRRFNAWSCEDFSDFKGSPSKE